MKRWILTASLLTLGAALLGGCGPKESADAPPPVSPSATPAASTPASSGVSQATLREQKKGD